MGFLDVFRGKDEINQLNKQLTDMRAEVSVLRSRNAELDDKRLATEQALVSLERSASDNAVSNTGLRNQLEQANVANSLLTNELESLKHSTVEQAAGVATVVAALNRKLEDVAPEIEAIKAERDKLLDETQRLQVSYKNREFGYQEREAKLAEKSEKLLHERQKFQQQAIELHAREQHWRNVVEPQLRRYEAHCALDVREPQFNALRDQLDALEVNLKVREADLIRRQCTDEMLAKRQVEMADWDKSLSDISARLDASTAEISKKKSEVDSRTTKLEEWARELAAFQERAKHLDEEASKIEGKATEQRAHHAARLVELQKERADIRREATELRRQERAITEKAEYTENLLSQAVLARDSATEKLRKAEVINGKLPGIKDELRASTFANAALQKNVDKLNSEVFSLRQKLTTRVALPVLEKICEMSVFGGETVLRWMFNETKPRQLAVQSGYLCSTGDGPWHENDFKRLLEEQEFGFYRMPDSDVEHIIVGREEWDGDSLLAQIDSRKGESLRVYSQEMWFAMMATGRDPFDEKDSELLQAFGQGHPALEFLMDLKFPWPLISTGDDGCEVEPPDPNDYVSESPLHKLGYTVGMTSGLSVAGRRRALKLCFETKVLEFSDDSSPSYRKNWGTSGSAQRLYRIAFHIKSMIDGRVGKDPRKPQSRIDWIADLKWLKSTYYEQFTRRFNWPDVSVR